MKTAIQTFFKNFLKCGLTGWCMEIIFTALNSFRNRDMTLKGQTSLWMFPIYGCAAVLLPISRLMKAKSFWLRGFTYMSLIFSTEFFTGKLLTRKNLCPWDYSQSRFQIGRVIRLDYAPYWFGAGLLFERLLTSSSSAPDMPASKTHRPKAMH